MNLLIKNAQLITAHKTQRADVLIQEGKISEIGTSLRFPEPITTIDAQGKYLIPGGIDPHVHLHLDVGIGFSSDDFYSGSKAALFGGTTTVIDFVTPHKKQSLVEALEERKKEAQNALTDYSFHVSPIDWHDNIEQEIKECKKRGITSFKVYLAYLKTIGLDEAVFFKVLKVVGEIGGMVTIHAEMGEEIEILRDQFYNEGKYQPKYHPLSRPAELEAEAVRKAIELAHRADCPLYIVHVSAADSVKYIAEAQQKGYKVWGETCPQYLLLDESKYEGSFEKTAPYVMSPPLRTEKDQTVLWENLAKGVLKTFGTDHCPFLMSQKELGKADFRKIPNGAGGIEHRLELLYTYGVLENKISINQWVNLCSTQPAKAFGMYPQKGEIAVGSDADLVIWNLEVERTISVKTHHQNCDSNVYEGFKIKGQAETVIRRGEILIQNAKWMDNPTLGIFIERQ